MTTLAETLTTHEVAVILGVTDSAVRNLVLREVLLPMRRGARPLRFRALDVERLRAERETHERRVEIADVWAEVDAQTGPGVAAGQAVV